MYKQQLCTTSLFELSSLAVTSTVLLSIYEYHKCPPFNDRGRSCVKPPLRHDPIMTRIAEL